jgi:hypothetical protein
MGGQLCRDRTGPSSLAMVNPPAMPPLRRADPTIVAACLAAVAGADSVCRAAKLARTTRSPSWSSRILLLAALA